jgi:hypothetical protein
MTCGVESSTNRRLCWDGDEDLAQMESRTASTDSIPTSAYGRN